MWGDLNQVGPVEIEPHCHFLEDLSREPTLIDVHLV
jgi:hypothetical protein